jgi:hypothetical protein
VRVSLRCLEAGMYEVQRGLERYAGTLLLLQRNSGWELVFRPNDPGQAVLGKVAEGFDTFRAARAWLATRDGQEWLDQLPKEAS